jgi:hypothetical protein
VVTTSPDAVAVRALELLRAGDDSAAWREIDDFAASGEVTPAVPGPAAGFREIGRELFWTHKAIPEYVRLQQEQLRRYGDDPAYVRNVTGVLYDLASFTWPGWGNEVRPEDRDAGRAAAERCVAMRENPAHADVEFGVTPAMAQWALGAHALAAGDAHAARSAFERARQRNLDAGEDDSLDRGYLALADLMERPEDSAAAARLESVLAELAERDDEDAAFIREQLVTARGIFVSEPER